MITDRILEQHELVWLKRPKTEGSAAAIPRSLRGSARSCSTLSAVARSRCAGTRVSWTAHAARYTGGLSVARFLRPLTYQRINDQAAGRELAEAVVGISAVEGLPAHGQTAEIRLARVASRV